MVRKGLIRSHPTPRLLLSSYSMIQQVAASEGETDISCVPLPLLSGQFDHRAGDEIKEDDLLAELDRVHSFQLTSLC